jgi:hypothetical protein
MNDINFFNMAAIVALAVNDTVFYVDGSGKRTMGVVKANNETHITVAPRIVTHLDDESIELTHTQAKDVLFVSMAHYRQDIPFNAVSTLCEVAGCPANPARLAQIIGCRVEMAEEALIHKGLHLTKNEDGFVVAGLAVVKDSRLPAYATGVEVLLQKESQRETVFYTGDDMNAIYDQCAANRQVLQYELSRGL